MSLHKKGSNSNRSFVSADIHTLCVDVRMEVLRKSMLMFCGHPHGNIVDIHVDILLMSLQKYCGHQLRCCRCEHGRPHRQHGHQQESTADVHKKYCWPHHGCRNWTAFCTYIHCCPWRSAGTTTQTFLTEVHSYICVAVRMEKAGLQTLEVQGPPLIWSYRFYIAHFDNLFSCYYQPNEYLTKHSLLMLITLNSADF